ncbi:MAG: hypothetical protein Q8P64_26025, partial [Deltaproteobacteria bacterium]|nr:hypothetical protein [Deltaproteobacteria bacterium]
PACRMGIGLARSRPQTYNYNSNISTSSLDHLLVSPHPALSPKRLCRNPLLMVAAPGEPERATH